MFKLKLKDKDSESWLTYYKGIQGLEHGDVLMLKKDKKQYLIQGAVFRNTENEKVRISLISTYGEKESGNDYLVPGDKFKRISNIFDMDE